MSNEFDTWDEPYLEDAPTYTLHSAKGVVWGTFIGSPLAAGVLLAINYWRLGKTTAAQITFALFAVGTAAFFALVYAMPDDLNIPNVVFTIPQLFMVYGVTNLLQADDIRAHIRNGGKLASAWAAVGIGVLCLIPVLGGIFGFVYLEEQSFGTVVKFGNDEV
ncbi:MAG: hypothetical protein KDA84_17865 [Planctomycetaceae bacterium]|nr:hypothetical protein [Planctomycetaceae bacterium]